jgi:Ca-activated chloride channel family protein
VSIELDLPPGFEIVRFSGEEYSGNPHDIEPQHLAPDDSMVFYMTIDTCAPEAVTSESPITVRAIHTDPITLEEHTTTSTSTFGALLGGDTALLAKGAAVYGYAEGLKAWQHAGTTADRHAAIETALDKVTAAEVLNPGDDDLAEIETLLRILE